MHGSYINSWRKSSHIGAERFNSCAVERSIYKWFKDSRNISEDVFIIIMFDISFKGY